MREAFALHCKSFTHFFNKKYWHIWNISVWNFNVSLTNDVVSFEQPGPELQSLKQAYDHENKFQPKVVLAI